MSAVESRLAATLAKHVYNEWGVDDDYCSCGASTSSNGWPAHVAAVIASSDDLAVFWPFSDSTTVRTYPRYREVGWSVHGEPEEPVTPSWTRDFAAALLAAAKAAEGVSERGCCPRPGIRHRAGEVRADGGLRAPKHPAVGCS